MAQMLWPRAPFADVARLRIIAAITPRSIRIPAFDAVSKGNRCDAGDEHSKHSQRQSWLQPLADERDHRHSQENRGT
jgi:hypothetical protein